MAIEFDLENYPGKRHCMDKQPFLDPPVISVVTKVSGEDEVSAETKNCVYNQTFPWTEWIISETRESGFRKARGEYILFLDAGEQMEPTFLEYCFWMLNKDASASFAFTAYCVGGEGGCICDESMDTVRILQRIKKGELLPKALFRREIVEKAIASYGTGSGKTDISDQYLWMTGSFLGGRAVQSRGEALFWYESLSDTVPEAEKPDFAAAPATITTFPVTDPGKHEFHLPRPTDFNRKKYSDDKRTGILFLLHWFSRGGADRFNIELIKGMDRKLYHVTVATTLQGENEWLQRARDAADDIFNIPNFMDMADFPEFLSYLIETRDIQVLFIDISLTGYYILPWIKKQYPGLCVVDYIHMVENFWRKGGYARVCGVMTSFIDHTYVCNSVTARELTQDFYIDEGKISTVHIGVDQHYFNINKVRKGILYETLGVKDNRPVILFPCRLCAQKRPFLMLKIAEQTARIMSDVIFVVVGDGPDLSEMKALVKQRNLGDNVFFTGAAEDMRPFYRDAKLTLICSLSEGLTLTAYESLAMGVPVISADVGGQRDLIDDEVGALIRFDNERTEEYDSRIFSAEEISLYFEAVTGLLSDKERWERASKVGRKRIEEGFTTEGMTAFFNKELIRIKEAVKNEYCREPSDTGFPLPVSEELYLMHIMGEQGIHPDFYGRPPEGISETSCFSVDPLAPDDIKELFRVVDAHGKLMTAHEKRLDSFDEVLMRHEEVVNRHEEVVNRHEKSINHQWEVQKMHETRLQNLEQPGLLKRIWRKLK